MARHLLVIAGYDLHRHAADRHRLQCRPSAGLGWIKESGETGEHQFTFIINDGIDQRLRLALPSDGQHAEAVLPQPVEQRLDARARRFVQVFQHRVLARRVRLTFVLHAQPKHVFRRTF